MPWRSTAEAVAKYEPDLVVAAGLAPARAQQLAKLNVKCSTNRPRTDVSQSYEQLTQLGDATGQPGRRGGGDRDHEAEDRVDRHDGVQADRHVLLRARPDATTR